MAELRQTFIRNLKYYRKLRGKRQLDLAMDLSKNPNYINSIENGKYFPSPETIEQIAFSLGIEPVQLFEKELPESAAINNHEINLKDMEMKLKEDVSKNISAVFAQLAGLTGYAISNKAQCQ